jgi:hypothetical protein
MKTVVKLLLMLAVLYAVVHAAYAAMTYYQLKDATEQMLTFGSETSTSQLQSRIAEKAAELDLPVQPEDVHVRRQGARTTASASYTQPVEVFPNYMYPMKFSYSVEAYSLNASTLGDSSTDDVGR